MLRPHPIRPLQWQQQVDWAVVGELKGRFRLRSVSKDLPWRMLENADECFKNAAECGPDAYEYECERLVQKTVMGMRRNVIIMHQHAARCSSARTANMHQHAATCISMQQHALACSSMH